MASESASAHNHPQSTAVRCPLWSVLRHSQQSRKRTGNHREIWAGGAAPYGKVPSPLPCVLWESKRSITPFPDLSAFRVIMYGVCFHLFWLDRMLHLAQWMGKPQVPDHAQCSKDKYWKSFWVVASNILLCYFSSHHRRLIRGLRMATVPLCRGMVTIRLEGFQRMGRSWLTDIF